MAYRGNVDRHGREVLDYLDRHRLDHTPDHYTFAHRVLFGDDPAFRGAVGRHTDGGVRITPEQVRQLLPPAAGAGETIRDLAPQIDALTLQVLDIAGDAAEATAGLNRDLTSAVADMLRAGADDVRPFVTRLIDRTVQAEERLRDAMRRAQQLRDNLNTLHDEAARDPLTGLLDRQGMERRLAAAQGADFTLAMIDIDRFATINAEYGRGVGDRVLRAVAETLREHCGSYPVARWTGDRFFVLFEGVPVADAADRIDAVRRKLTERRLKLRENDRPLGTLSFSAGIAAARSRAPAAVVQAAEALLREAKRRGRNNVVSEKAAIGV